MHKGDNNKFDARILRCVLLVQIHLRIDGSDTNVGNQGGNHNFFPNDDITNPKIYAMRMTATSINTDTYSRRPYAWITLSHKHCRRRSEVVDDEDDAAADVIADEQLDD